MHHNRRTHNAHNETQRRLMKVLSNGHIFSWRNAPHYSGDQYIFGFKCFVPDWVDRHWTNSVSYKNLGFSLDFTNEEEANKAKERAFLIKNSRSSGSKSYYRFVKKMLHKKWRRKKMDDMSYSIKGSHCSWSDAI